MTLRIADRVQETCAAPSGSAAFATGGTIPAGYIGFAAVPGIASGDLVPYTGLDTAGHWEVGLGTWTAGSLARTYPRASNNGAGAYAAFSGTVTLFLDATAELLSVAQPLPWRTGRWYASAAGNLTGGNPSAGNLTAMPIYVPPGAVPSALGFALASATGSTASCSWQAGIYADAGGQPGALVPGCDTGAVALGGSVPTGGISASISPTNWPGGGWYWLAGGFNGANMPSVQTPNWGATAQNLMAAEQLGNGTAPVGVAGTGTRALLVASGFTPGAGALPSPAAAPSDFLATCCLFSVKV